MRKVKMNYRCLSTGSLIKVIFVFLGGLKRYWGGLKSNPLYVYFSYYWMCFSLKKFRIYKK